MLRVASRNNPRYREVARLVSSSRDRRKAGRCVLEGEHLVAAHLERIGVPEVVVVNEETIERPGVAALLARLPGDRVLVVPASMFDGLGTLPPDVGLVAVAPAPAPSNARPGRFCVLLEDLQDPGNLGSILRTAAAFGVDQVHLSKHCAFAWAPKVLRAGQGAHFHLEIHENVDLVVWSRAYRAAGGSVVATVAAGGVAPAALALAAPVAIVVGNEGAGVSAALRAQANALACVPMPGRTESLNAAAAAAVVLDEAIRQGVTAAGRR